MFLNLIMTETQKPVLLDAWTVDIMASSGLFDVEMKDGRVVDLKEAWERGAQMSGYDWGDFKKDMQRVISKPLKYAPQIIAIVTGVGAIAGAAGVTGGVVGAIAEVSATVTGAVGGVIDKLAIDKLIATKQWKVLNAVARNVLKASGVYPDEANIKAYVQKEVEETVTDWGENGVPDEVVAYQQEYNQVQATKQTNMYTVAGIAAVGLGLGLVSK